MRVVSRELQGQELEISRSINSGLNLPTNLIKFSTMCLLPIWESAHHLMIKPRNDVNMHMEDLLGSGPAICLSYTDTVSRRGFLNPLHDLGHGCEDAPYFFARHFQHVAVVFLGNHQCVSRVQRMNVQEGQGVRVFIDDRRICLLLSNLTKDTILLH